jgi:hypothetical protein
MVIFVRIITCVGHAEESCGGVLHLKLFVVKVFAVNANAAGSIALVQVTALEHEPLDHAVEFGALVGLAVNTGRRQGEEILDGLGRRLAEQADDQPASFDIADFHVEVNLLGDFQSLGSLCACNVCISDRRLRLSISWIV